MEPFEISNSDFTEWDSALLVQHYQKYNLNIRPILSKKDDLPSELSYTVLALRNPANAVVKCAG
ncbi:MAG: hypothetical protein GY749_05560 [Desulfobacteraceae bacterium]|nr:hypothetical protein [Desulfobacteraceae bacterium]